MCLLEITFKYYLIIRTSNLKTEWVQDTNKLHLNHFINQSSFREKETQIMA